MQVKEIMTPTPASCTPKTPLEQVARLMVDFDCGEIPVVDDLTACKPVGVITDRDITCRSVAKGLNPLDLTAGDCMSTSLIYVFPDDNLNKCYTVMEENQIRRVPVVDAGGKCVGIVSLADIAQRASMADAGEVLQEVSASSAAASRVV